jgi:23S rRNA pseudouridine1911/1915/1917 synthase
MFGQKRRYLVEKELVDKRADIAISLMESDVSRQYLQKLFDNHKVILGKKVVKRSYKVKEGDILEIDYPKPIKLEIDPVDIPIDVVYEDEYLLVVNKAPGMVVHPSGTGKYIGESLVNAVLAHVGDGLKGIGGVLRPGIVHRLDKDTSGLIVIAKTDITHRALVDIFKNRQIKKHYLALVYKNVSDDGIITGDIGRHRVNRKKMSIDGIAAREAKTEFSVLDRMETHIGPVTLLDIRLHTGRTHQIRVHFMSIGNPIVGDTKYGDKKVNKLFAQKYGLERQFLHAYKLSFVHPETSKKVDIEVGLPPDLEKVMKKLKSL